MESSPKVAELSETEQRWVVTCVKAAMDWAGTTELPTLAELDDLAVRRMAEPENEAIAIDVIAVAIGEHLRRGSRLAWKVVTDDYGTAIALYRPVGHIVVVPQSIVAKRWPAGLPFVVALVTQMLAELDRIAHELEPVN